MIEDEFDMHYPHTESETLRNQNLVIDNCKTYASFMTDAVVANNISTSVDQLDVVPHLRSLAQDI